MLAFDGVEFSYPDQNLFTNLNFTVDSGEFTFLIGRSGAGKTVLLKNKLKSGIVLIDEQ